MRGSAILHLLYNAYCLAKAAPQCCDHCIIKSISIYAVDDTAPIDAALTAVGL